jgi:hypothetical protein
MGPLAHKLLSWWGLLPFWPTKELIGHRQQDGHAFVMTVKEVWWFGRWVSLLVDVRLLGE